jgi:nicotinate-nucleotide adenylyltransferase
MKIAILGGSFNPIHNGHIEIARIVYNKLKPSLFFFVPTYKHPLKSNVAFLPYSQRYYLIEKALTNYPRFQVSNLDKTKNNLSYTTDLIKRFQKKYPNGEFYFIIGADNVYELKLWHNYKWLLDNVKFVVLTRKTNIKENMPDYAKDFIFYHIKPINISSTMIRERIKKGEPITNLVPRNIENDVIKFFKSLNRTI